MAKTFHLTIAKVGEHLFDDEAVSAILPGTEGLFEILANHEAFISRLAKGQARVKTQAGETLRFEIPEGGIAEISQNQATVLV